MCCKKQASETLTGGSLNWQRSAADGLQSGSLCSISITNDLNSSL